MEKEDGGDVTPERDSRERRGKKDGSGKAKKRKKANGNTDNNGRQTPTYSSDFTQQSPDVHSRQQVILWLQETYRVVPNSGMSTPKEDVYRDYSSMCATVGKSAMARATFGKLVHCAFPGITCNRLGRRGSTKHSYRWLHRQLPMSDEDEGGSPGGDHQQSYQSPQQQHQQHHQQQPVRGRLSPPTNHLNHAGVGADDHWFASRVPSSAPYMPSTMPPNMSGGAGQRAASPPPSPVIVSTSLPPLPAYPPPFSPYPSGMLGGTYSPFALPPPLSSSSASSSPSPAHYFYPPPPSSSALGPHPLPPPRPLLYPRSPSPSSSSYSSNPYDHAMADRQQHSYATSGPWSSSLDSLLYDTQGLPEARTSGHVVQGRAQQPSPLPSREQPFPPPHHQQHQQQHSSHGNGNGNGNGHGLAGRPFDNNPASGAAPAGSPLLYYLSSVASSSSPAPPPPEQRRPTDIGNHHRGGR